MVVIVKVTVVAPSCTVTDGGTVATDVLLLDRDTTAPPLGAGPFNVTVPVEVFPPVTLDGLRERDFNEGGFTVRFEDRVTPPYEPEMFTAVEPDTGVVVIVKVALVAPSGTVTVEGTGATVVLLLDSVTDAPPLGAGPFSVTVPVELFPPVTLDGLRERDDSEVGFTVRLEDLVTPPYKPEIFTAVELGTEMVVIVKVALVAPLDTVTDGGTVATDGLLLDSDTLAPPLGAGLFNVTVPVEVFPPTTLEGFNCSELTAGGVCVTVRLAVFVILL